MPEDEFSVVIGFQAGSMVVLCVPDPVLYC